ncbi:hypothetical protein BCR32DRAFT_292789 [Anaeromyces robustus]|uniref:SH3 domain-containing protein n=1 Tax=Anaeromyces robustus TaxID=1754192 RepID=A0A1Y1X930_9FUNG|nr:hypothetical protein BCR32DRAFT_292789 [Anaeromyces robustus]|eukprot:ORX82218.1 hypothetical protein BCR32DRAFT_292789 [Anaeromyces robustus]
MSFSTGFHDIRTIENCLNDGVQFLHEYKEYLKDIFQVEKEYVKNKLSIINKFKTKQEKRYTLPELTTSHRAWIVFLGNMEKKCDERIVLLERYNTEVVEPLKIIINKKEEEKKKQILFFKKLSNFVDRYCQENEKNSIRYLESCDAVMNNKKKCDKKQDKMEKGDKSDKGDKMEKSDKTDKIDKNEMNDMIEKLTNGASNYSSSVNINQSTQSSLSNVPSSISSIANCNYYFNDDGMIIDDEVESTSTTNSNNNSSLVRRQTKKGKKILNPIMKMNNKKNFYIMSLKVANALMNKFYDEDMPYIFDELQSINESIYQNFKEICTRQIEYEKELYNTMNEKDDEILRSLNTINISKDSMIYLRCYSKEWNRPETYQFVPTSHWDDKEELVIDGPTSVVLKNMVQKGQERMYKIDLDINSKTSEYKKFEMICNTCADNPNYSKGEIDIMRNKKNDIMENIIMARNIKLICEVQINEISKYIGNEQQKVERQHVFKPKKIINPTVCDYCKEKLWGKAYICKLCTFSCHIKCELKVPLECNGVKTKRKSLRINCSQISDTTQNISSPFKTAGPQKPFNLGNGIPKIKEEDDDEEKLNKTDETSDKLITKDNNNERSKLYQCTDISDEKVNNPFSNIKEILWYIDNNEFPSITADSMMDIPTVGELIKRNSVTQEDIDMLHMKQRNSIDYTSDCDSGGSNNDNDLLLSPTIENRRESRASSIYYNTHSGHSAFNSSESYNYTVEPNDLLGGLNSNNENELGRETISIIDTNVINNNKNNHTNEEINKNGNNNIINNSDNENNNINNSNRNSKCSTTNTNTNSNNNDADENSVEDNNNIFKECITLKDNSDSQKINLDIRPSQMSNLTYQLSKSKSLPMLSSVLGNEEEYEEDGDEDNEIKKEKKEKMAIERRNSYLREKFYLKNNINRPQEENFTKMIAMYDYQHQSEDELDLSSNEEVTLIIPDDGSGWAMVSSAKGCGLVPANYLMECAKVIEDYTPEEDDNDKVQVKTGDILLILEKDYGTGYIRVRVKDEEGLVPSSCVSPIS